MSSGRCWFAHRGDCDGHLDKAHLIPKQRIKREVSKDPEVVWHRASWTYMCRFHHGQFDNRILRIRRSELPPQTEQFAEITGLGWSLDADYGNL